MKTTSIACFLCCLLCFAQSTASQNQNIHSGYIFSTITIDNGLPHNFIDDIFKDSRGFIWISTAGGLARYDGYDFLIFNINSFPVSLKNNSIRKVCEDNFKRLWVISSGGVDIIDLFTMQKSNPKNQSVLFDLIKNSTPVNILKDKNGHLWLLSNDIIHKITFNQAGDIRQIDSSSRQEKYIFSTICEVDGAIYTANNGKIYTVLSNLSGELTLQRAFNSIDFGDNVYISSLVKKENSIWIGTENGLFRYNLNNHSSDAFLYDENDPGSISQNMITDILVRNDGVLVAATLRGLNFFDTSNNTFERISYQDKRIYNTLNNDFINCLMADGDHLWIGTEVGGVNKMMLPKLLMHNYVHRPDDPNSLSKNPVNAVLEDKKGNLWVGTVEGGLNCKRKDKNGFVHYTARQGHLVHNSVSSLEEDRQGNLWVGTWGGGISVLDTDKHPACILKNIKLETNYIGILKYDSINNGMWIGTNRNIYFYDIQSQSIKEPLHPDLTQNIRGTLGCLLDRKNQLWIGTSIGVIKIDPLLFDREKFRCKAGLFATSDLPFNQIFLPNISCMYQAHDGSIWMGSNGYGICKLIEKENDYLLQNFTVSEGLTNNTVSGILEDEQGLIWISTALGISCYNPDSNVFTNYTKDDGLANNHFYWNAAFKSSGDKSLYFGGVNGLTQLSGNQKITSGEQSKVTFTKLQILNKTIGSGGNKYIKWDISYAQRVDLHEMDKSFSIEFSALHYDNPSTVTYSYRMLGFDNKWIHVDATRRFANYTNLRPGTYKFQVQSMSKSYNGPDNIAELEIVVHPFFYKTTWFISISIILLIVLIVRIYRQRVASLKKQQKILQTKVERRTKELENRKQLLEEQALELKLQNNALKTQNEKISLQRKQLLDMSEKVQEAMADRISFFTNITHEFRTPITLISGPVERALKLSNNPKVIEQLQLVRLNSKHLLSLINQLMDFRKVESESISINLKNNNLPAFLDELLTPFDSLLIERRIAIRKIYHLHSFYLLFDEEVIRKLINNLLANAIQFTPDNGKITLYVCSIPATQANKEKLYICVQDSGSGIKESDLIRIFNRFYQSKGNVSHSMYGQSGTGIGLYLCKSIVNLLGGSIYAKNNHSRGASFRVLLPLLRENGKPDQPESEPETLPDPEWNDAGNVSNNQKMTILVVEDNPDMRKYISSILHDYYKVEEAEQGEQALEILKEKHIDFIISDLMMPLMDGLELSQRVRSDFSISHIPFLMLTAKSNTETQISSYKIGVDDFLTKPFDEELLLARINNMLERRKAYQRRFSLHMDVSELNIREESNDEQFLHRAIDVLKANYKDAYFDIGDFIDAMKMSKSLLNKKMQILIGQSTGQFIRNYRLNTAYEMIRKSNGNLTISEIAYAVGFNDPKYFTRCFTKHFGVAPREAKEN
jgi:signal transduction histidine kinase/ligand-binding sensor domain-containing protein/CheY-like chemotaxis protein/AraC-like DNA-binding protein